jgi:hypothetical protein
MNGLEGMVYILRHPTRNSRHCMYTSTFHNLEKEKQSTDKETREPLQQENIFNDNTTKEYQC